MDPLKVMEAGADILADVMTSHGFVLCVLGRGAGSGGMFAAAEFVRGDRRLAFHFRYSLGLVTYHACGLEVGHETLMRALVPQGERPAYPGHGNDPLDGFRHLRDDLVRYGQTFLSGGDQELKAAIARAQELESERPKGFAALSHPRTG